MSRVRRIGVPFDEVTGAGGERRTAVLIHRTSDAVDDSDGTTTVALVARLHAAHDIRLADEPEPVARDGESVVAVRAVGLCGSDLHWYTEGGIGDAVLSRPLVGGHELAGVVRGGSRDGERVA